MATLCRLQPIIICTVGRNETTDFNVLPACASVSFRLSLIIRVGEFGWSMALDIHATDEKNVEPLVGCTVEGLTDFQAKLNKMDMERMVLTNLAPDFFGIKNHCTTAHLVQNRLV